MGWQDIYKKKMQESGLAAGDINFVDVDTFHKREKERWASEVATGSVQTVTAPAKQKKEKYVASPYGTFLGGFSYKGNTRRQKSEQELADEAAQQAAYIKEYQRLAGLDLDSYGKQVESAKKAAQKNRTQYNVRAFGGYDASRMTDEERTYAAMQADYNKARDIQYDIKGQAALENLTAEQSKAVETLATERSDTAKRQTAWTALQKTGLSDDEISQLVNYQRNIPKRQKNAERYAEMQDAAEAYAETNPGLATVASVPANLLSGIGTFDAAMRKLSDPDSPVDYKSGAFLPYAYSRGVRDTVTKNLESDYGKGASFAYGVGTSILDSAATVGLAALGIPAGVASATLGGAAATSAMTEAKARGLSDEKAILTGVLSGVAETALEKFSLESLIAMKLPTGTAKQRVVGALKNAAVQAGIEGSEEMFTDFANLIFDKWVNGSMSDVQQRIAVYMAGGMDYDEARKKVLGETVKDVALDFVAGGLAGGLMGGGNMAIRTAAQGAYDARVNDARTVVRQRAGVTGSYQAAEDGKTSYNGQETSVRSVVKDGKVELTTGETVDPKDVQFSDRNTADLYEGAIRTAENAGAAQVFVDSYTGGDVSTYILGMQEAYHNGKEGVPLEDAGGFAEDLSDAQRRAAWEQGRAAASVPDLKDYGFSEKGTQAWNKVQENEAVRNNRRLRAGFTAMYQAGMRGESASAVKSDAAKYIPPSVQTAAYQAGLADAAESLARETAAVQFVSSAGSESGLVDNEYSRKLAEEKSGTAALLSMLGKDLGVRVEIVPKVLGGNANGQYVAGRNLVQIAADADDAFAFVAAHEVTHRMQSLAPEEYRSYRDYAMRFRAQELGEEGAVALVERYRARSEEAGVTLTQEEAMDEIAANFTMQMIEDGGLFEDFARENRSEAGKLLDALKAFIAKVKALFRGKEARDKAAREAYGTDMATLEECVARWQKAYTAAGKAAQNAKTAAGEGSGEGRYQIKKIDGRLMTVIDTQNDTRDFKAAEAYLKTLVNTDHPFSTILMDAQPVYVGKDLPGEYRSSEYTKSMLSKLRDVKMQAATNLDEMLLLAENGEWRENVKPKHAKDAQNGWYRYDAEFAVPILNAKKAVDHYTVYGGTLLIRNDADGKSYLYDLLDIEKKKVISAASFSAETHSEVLPPKPSVNSISTSDGNVNAKFSLKKPLEETKDLLALHNLTEKNLLDAVRLGGLPMPSIAVVKGDAGHSEYGPISFVFCKDTIDPQLFRSNKVYGYDAWTPTAPQIEYEVNEKAAGRIHDLFYRMQREKGRDFADPLYSVANTLEDELNRKGGLDKVVEPMRDDPRVMNIYLEDTGRGAVEKVMRQNVSRMDENQQEMSEFLIRELGADAVDGFRPTGNEAPIAARRRWFAEHGEALNEALRKYYEKLGLPAKDAADVVNAETNAAKTKYLLNTRKYLSGNTETVTEEVDLDATNNAIRKKVDKADYDRWLDELFKGVVKNEGIYNGKDYYTSSGNRRSFSATHYEITLENIVKAMKRGDQKGANTVFGGQAIWGVASKDYNSIDEIKADSGRLVKMTEEEYSAIRQEYSARLAELANEIKDPSAQNDFIASDDAATAIVETLRTKRTAAAIDKELRTYPTLRIRTDTAGKVLQLFEDISNMPTGYFEAKPQRAVGFDEVLAAVIPDDTSANARAALAQAGVKTIEYKSGDEQSRTDAVNSVEGARFQLKSARELEQEVRELKKERTALLSRNKTLEARVEKWRKETRRSSPSVRADDVKKMASTVIREYGSSVDYQDIEADMTELGKALMADDVSMETLRPHARAAAEKIIDGVLVQSESGAELLEIRDHLKGTTLKYTDDGTIPDFSQWRKSQKGKLRISKDSGVDVDVAYAELTEMFGEGYFPSSIIHTGDQLMRMSEVLENVGRIYENPFDGYRDAAVTELSNLLIDGMIGEDVRQTEPTFADRKALELQETKARLTQMLIRTREGRDRQVERMRRHYAEQTKAGRERRNATALRAKIARHTADLSRKLLTPTDKQHIPENLRTSVAVLLSSINQESAYSYDADGRLVHNTEGDPTKRTQAAIALKSAYDEILRSGEALVIDPDLLGSEGAGLLDQVMAFGNKRMADMNSEELTTVWQAVRAIEQSVSTFNKSLASQRYETVSSWAESLKHDSATRTRKNRKLSLDLADPYTFFSAYGESGRQIFRTLRNAQDRQNTMLKTIQAAAERFADKTVFKNRNDRHTFTTEAGQTLTLTTGQVMNLYNLVGRGEQAVHHLMVGGVVQPEILRNGKNPAIPRGTENIRLTENDLKAITGTLTEVQKSVAEGLQKIASGHLAAWGNEASMQVYGYRKFTEKNYWPIKAAQEGTTQNSEKGADMAREIKNMGSAKALVPNASNALDIGDVYDVFSQNASDMIQYATLLAPMEDINRLYNYRFRDAEGNLTGKVVKHVLTDVYGEAAQKYWRNLMRDVQNGMEKSGTSAITKSVEKVVGGMKAGSVGFNLRVVAQQPTAYFRAAAVIDPAHMAKGLVKGATEGNGWEKAKKYAPIAAIKDTSGFDQSGRYTIAQNVFGQDGNALMNWMSEASGWAAGKADAVTWEKIWNACEWAVVSEGGYEKGSDGFYQRTAQLFTEVIDQSQVVDGILQRAQIMRDSNGLTKQATAFMGEPLKSLNMLMRSYDAWRYETDTPKKSKALKRFARTVSALLVTDVVNSLVQSVIDGLRDDDKDKAYGERIMAAWLGDKDDQTVMQRLLGGNLWENLNPVGRIPYAKDVLSMLQGFTVSRMDADAVGDLIDAAELFVKSAQDEGSKTTAYAAKKLLTAGSKIFGISIANVGRDAWAIARSIAQGTGNVRAMYEMERAIYRLAPDSGNNKRYYKLLYMAMGKDEETYRYIYDDMKKRGYTDSQLQTGIKNIIKDSGADEDDMRKQLEEIGYSGDEAQEIMDKWAFKEKYGYDYSDKREAFAEGTITRQQLIDEIVKIGGNTREEAESVVTVYEWQNAGVDIETNQTYIVNAYEEYGKPNGIDRNDFVSFCQQASRISGEDLDGDGKTDSGSKKKNVLRLIDSMPLSASQKDALYYQQGYAESTIGDAPWH